MQPFGHNRYGPKIGGLLCPFGGGEAGFPSNTMWPGPRPTCMPSFVMIHSTVWPQYTNVTDRQDNDPIAQGEPFYKRSPKKHDTQGHSHRQGEVRCRSSGTRRRCVQTSVVQSPTRDRCSPRQECWSENAAWTPVRHSASVTHAHTSVQRPLSTREHYPSLQPLNMLPPSTLSNEHTYTLWADTYARVGR